MIYNNIIIGSGFSAYVTYLMLKKKALIISNESDMVNNRLRRKKLEINKLFYKKGFFSFGNIKFKLNKQKIFDCIGFGGSTNIWGGIINTKQTHSSVLEKFKEDDLEFKKLSFETTGSASNSKNYFQIQYNNEIFNTKLKLKNIVFAHVEKIKKEKKSLLIKVVKNKKQTVYKSKNIYLAIGAIQLIELLVNSKIITKNTAFQLSEYNHYFSFKWPKKNKKKSIIRYSFAGILKHYLGYQKKINKFIIILLNFVPIFINQIFESKKKYLKFFLDHKKLIIYSKSNKKFGDSIHFCDLKIDNENISNYIKKYSKNIHGVSMPFVIQKKPGPISNDIANLVYSIVKL